MSQKPLIVCITGAAGQIAYAFLNLLCSGDVFGANQLISVRLLDIEKCVPNLKGVQLELEDCAYHNVVGIEVGSDPYKIFKDADVVVFFGGFPRLPGQERKDLLQINNKIFKEQGQALNAVASRNCKSLVIANPANTNCLTLMKNCPGIPRKNFTCLTRLDHNRALAQIALKANTQAENVKNVIIWGNHSTTQYPDYHFAKVNGKPVLEVVNDEQYFKTDFITRIQKRGQEVLEVRKNSSVMSAAFASRDHLRSWFLGTENGEFVSMGVCSDGNPYGVPEDLVFSFPVQCRNFEWQIQAGLPIDQFSQEKLNLTTKELQEEKEIAFTVVYKNPLNVCITGAAGQIAYSFANLLCSGQVFGLDQPINLRLLDIPQCQQIVKGLILELEDCAYKLVKSIQCGSDPKELFKDVDVLICFGGFPRKEGQERKELLQINNKIYKEQAVALNEVGSKNCKVVVIANPANTNCLTLASNCPNIPKKNFTCLTRLDHNRARAQLGLKANVPVEAVRNVAIWGNHSTTQYPDFYHAEINGKKATEVITDINYLQNDFITRVQKRGGEVLNARKNSSVMSAAFATRDHLRTWFFGTNEGEWVSMGVYTENQPYGIQNDLVFSFPVKCKNFEWEIVQGLEINEFSKAKLNATQKELLEEKADSLN